MIVCYRCTAQATELYDVEVIWAWVQARGGHIELRQDCVDFFIDEYHSVELVLRWSHLARQPQLDWYN